MPMAEKPAAIGYRLVHFVSFLPVPSDLLPGQAMSARMTMAVTASPSVLG